MNIFFFIISLGFSNINKKEEIIINKQINDKSRLIFGHSALKELCPDIPDGYEVPDFNIDDHFENAIYACEIMAGKRIIFENSFILASCKFDYIISHENGGSIILNSKTDFSDVLIYQCEFNSCKSNQNGGCIYISLYKQNSDVCIIQSVFKQCKSNQNGGSIYFYGFLLKIDQCIFTENIAEAQGSDIFLTSRSVPFNINATFSLANNTFYHSFDNEKVSESLIYYSNTKLELFQINFVSNYIIFHSIERKLFDCSQNSKAKGMFINNFIDPYKENVTRSKNVDPDLFIFEEAFNPFPYSSQTTEIQTETFETKSEIETFEISTNEQSRTETFETQLKTETEIIFNSETAIIQTITQTEEQTNDQSDGNRKKNQLITIILISVGIICVVVIVLFIIICHLHKKNVFSQPKTNPSSEIFDSLNADSGYNYFH